MSSRRHVHTRSIKVDAYVRDDGLWDIEATLADTKSRDFPLASETRPAGEPVHDMVLTLTVDTRMNVVAAAAQSKRVPYPGFCEPIAADYGKLVGLNLARGFREAARERLGGPQGCTHLTELCGVLPTVAVQGFAGEVVPIRDVSQSAGEASPTADKRPFQIDRCYALRANGPAVARFYPRWSSAPTASPAAEGEPASD